MPILIAETGWPTADFGSYEYGDWPDPVITANHWEYMADEYSRHGTVGVCVWQQDSQYEPDNDTYAVAFGVRYAQYTTQTVNGVTYHGESKKAHTDMPNTANGTDSRRKGFVAQMDAPNSLKRIRSAT